LIAYHSESREAALTQLYQRHADVVVLDTPADESELTAGLTERTSWFCQDCRRHWPVEASWFRCTYSPCRCDQLARANTAMVVAQLALQKLLEDDE
jgi:hypothetical protein